MPINLSGSLVLTGSITATGGITMSGSIASASYALNTSFLNNSGSGEFVPTGSFNTFSSSILTYTGSANSRLSSIESKTGSYATTGSNTFIDGQYLSSSFNPTGFSTTASLYTDGGLRVTRDAYISGTLYLNNVTVFGTQSVAYISSSQLNIGTNLISVNTDTPLIRFGGLSVYDSGSTGLTGSILWDSENNHWIYSNPSGSSYSGGMFISGPRTSTLGSETGTTACMLLAGQGGDHLTSSIIYHSSTATCIPNTLIGSAICSTMLNTSCIGVGTTTPLTILEIAANNNALSSNNTLRFTDTDTATEANQQIGKIEFYSSDTSTPGAGVKAYMGAFASDTTPDAYLSFATQDGSGNPNPAERLRISSEGIACFACQVCAPFLSAGDGTQCNADDAPLTIKRGVGFAGLDFKSLRTTGNIGGTRFYDCAGVVQAQQLVEVDGSFNFYNATSNNRFKITSTGITCFACQMCVPSLNIGTTAGYTTATQGQFFSKGGGGMFTANLLSGGWGRHFTMQRNDATKFHIGVDNNDYFTILNSSDCYLMSVTSGGSAGIGGSVFANGISGAETSLSITDANAATLYLRSQAAAGKNWALYASNDGSFIIRDHTAGSARMYFSCTGNIGVGTTSVSTESNLFLGAQGVAEGGQLTLQKATNCNCATHLDNYQNSFRILSGTDTGSTAVHMTIDHITKGTTFYGALSIPYWNFGGRYCVVGTSFAVIGPSQTYSGLHFVSFTHSNAGNTGYALMMSAWYPGQLTIISQYDPTGLGVCFRMNGNNMEMKTASGTVNATILNITI